MAEPKKRTPIEQILERLSEHTHGFVLVVADKQNQMSTYYDGSSFATNLGMLHYTYTWAGQVLTDIDEDIVENCTKPDKEEEEEGSGEEE